MDEVELQMPMMYPSAIRESDLGVVLRGAAKNFQARDSEVYQAIGERISEAADLLDRLEGEREEIRVDRTMYEFLKSTEETRVGPNHVTLYRLRTDQGEADPPPQENP